MKEQARNLAVGATVIVALGLVCGMILLFTGLPQMFQRGYEIKFSADTTHDAHVGDSIYLAGLRIGRVTSIGFADQARPSSGVIFAAKIDHGVALPGNARICFYTRGLVGSAYMEVSDDGVPRIDPATGEPLETFPTDGSITMEGVEVGSSLIPKEITDAVKGLSDLASNLNALIAPQTQPAGEAGTQPATAPAGMHGTLARLNRTLDALAAVMGDTENQRNIKDSLANLSQATAAATEAMAAIKQFAVAAQGTSSDVSELTRKLIESADRVSDLMATLNRAATKIESGDGSAGKLLNDPKLYQNLVDASQQMNLLMKDFRELVEAWKKNGMQVKLK